MPKKTKSDSARKKILIWVGSIVGACVVLILMTQSILRQQNIQCEICLSFQGQTQCSQAFGSSENEALDGARQNACALLASGVTETLACQRIPATKTQCLP